MRIEYIIFILLIHFLADFALQTPEQAEKKSTDSWALAAHVLVYSGVWWIASAIYLGWDQGALFACITFSAHFLTDFVTSRLSKPFFSKKDYHNGFVVVGFDQMLHYIQLILTFNYLL